MAVRLRDVASLANVSERTVSNVVTGYKHVSPAMRQRVQAAIDQLGYTPNITARRLVQGRTGTLGLAVPAIDSPYFAELAAIIIDEAASRGYTVLVEQTGADPARELATLTDREHGLIDGLIFQPSALTSTQVAQARKDTPLVILGESAAPLGTAHVMIDNVAAARLGTKHLLDAGRTRIAYLGASSTGALGAIAHGRIIGWQQALEEAGRIADPRYLIQTQEWTSREGSRAMDRFLDEGNQIDGLLCSEDTLAIGALSALSRRGIAVPDDIAVVGWDDIAPAEFSYPPLTTISPDRSAIARTALDLLVRQVGGSAEGNIHVNTPFTLVKRQSA